MNIGILFNAKVKNKEIKNINSELQILSSQYRVLYNNTFIQFSSEKWPVMNIELETLDLRRNSLKGLIKKSAKDDRCI